MTAGSNQRQGALRVAARNLGFLLLALALGLGGSGCVYHGGSGDFMDGPGTPLGVTVLRIPFEKFVTAAPPPAGFSSTYQKMLLDRQRLARQQAEQAEQETREKEKPAGMTSKDGFESTVKPSRSAS